ncbi:efflux RND transporter permease subunit [Spirosoma endophyticum]|uniref:Hydrophobic/amphiphilic exporter-1, HAE1 family n=1 Tax=Spirosoma endophyticum TaxID=662367 RepID=A0A1I2C4M8_9BACT|nr:efflux RND transporter permease subunit [Spirosoma endophyticum]SFE62753.1 hydrophobic/amphiphilic exporter-1, HAE1 family [Spirosoma endophyticum]
MSVTEIAIKRPTLVVVAFTVLGILGFISYKSLNYTLLPKFDAAVVTVITTYPGAAAGEVENSVTRKLEDAVSSLENLKNISSTSQEGLSIIQLELNSDADPNQALQDAQRKVNAVLSQLPDEVESPTLQKFSTDDVPVIRMGARANLGSTQLYDLVDDQIRTQLTKVDGVGQVTLTGGRRREIRIGVDPDKLKLYNLSLGQVTQAVTSANLDYPTGRIETDQAQYAIRLAGKFTDINQIRNASLLTSANGTKVVLSDIATVTDGIADATTINRINGRESVGISIQKQTDANAVAISQQVRGILGGIEKQYANIGLKFEITSDSSTYTLASAEGVIFDLEFAVVLVALVMLLFLHSIRNAFIVMVSVPASIISVFVPMYLLGFTLNLMTLMALSLVVGILVDDSIVVLENIYRHLEMGKDRRTASLDGRNEIGFTAVAITMVDVVVFLPLVFVQGLIANIIREFSLVVVFSTLMSLIVSFTITPLLASRFAKETDLNGPGLGKRFLSWFEGQFDSLKHGYARLLAWSLVHKRWVYLTAIALFVASIGLVTGGFIGTTFFPQSDQGEFIIQIEGEPFNSLAETNRICQKIEKQLMQNKLVTKVNSNVGYSSSASGGGLGSTPYHKAEITVTILPKKERTISVETFAAQTKAEILKTPGLNVKSAPLAITGGANAAPIQILLQGNSQQDLQQAAALVKQVIKSVSGTTDVELAVDDPKPELKVNLDRRQMAQYGVSVANVGATLQTAFSGNTDSKYRVGSRDYDIRVELNKFNRQNKDDVGNLTVPDSRGKLIEIRQIADLSLGTGATQLTRYNRVGSLFVNANVVGRPTGTVGTEIDNILKTKQLPGGVTYKLKGDLERQSDAFGSLGLALGMAITFVYLLMVALYNSYFRPFVVLFSIPMAVIGAFLALALAEQAISFFVMLGMIMLIGLVAKNAILLVDFANAQKEEGKSTIDALVEAGRERIRPILMTTIAMAIGLLPMALATGDGSESKNGLAWVIIGGLISSLLLTLVLVPTVYLTFENVFNAFSRLYRRLTGNKNKPVPTKPAEV